MTDDLHKRAEAIVSAMTPGPWEWDGASIDQKTEPWNTVLGLATKGPQWMTYEVLELSRHDGDGIAFLRNMAPHWLAVVRLLRSVASEDAVRETLCCYTQGVALLDALATYDSALKKELGP